jgi:hypothetical protein
MVIARSKELSSAAASFPAVPLDALLPGWGLEVRTASDHRTDRIIDPNKLVGEIFDNKGEVIANIEE